MNKQLLCCLKKSCNDEVLGVYTEFNFLKHILPILLNENWIVKHIHHYTQDELNAQIFLILETEDEFDSDHVYKSIQNTLNGKN